MHREVDSIITWYSGIHNYTSDTKALGHQAYKLRHYTVC